MKYFCKPIGVLIALLFCLSSSNAQVALRWNPVVTDTIAETPFVDLARFQNAVKDMQPGLESSMYSGNTFARLEEVTNKDELLLAFITVSNLNLQQWSSTENLSHLVFFRIAANLQIVDPVSGQVVFSISDYLFREDWDHNGNPALNREFQELIMFKKERDSGAITQLNYNLQTKSREEVPVNATDVFADLLRLGAQEMIQQAKKQFQPARIEAQVAFAPKSLPGRRRVRGTSTEPYVLNKGRQDGLFPEMLLYSQDKNTFLRVTESYPTYSLALMESGGTVQQWDSFQSFKMDMGTPDAQALASVTRVLFTDSVLQHEDTRFLRESENALQKEFGERNSSTLNIPAYHISYASLLNSAVLRTGNVRMTYPLIGLVELDNAKIEMQDLRNQLDFDRFSSYLRPDFGLTAIVSNLSKHTIEIPGGHRITYSLLVSVHLYDLRTGEIVASGTSQKSRRYDRIAAMGITVQELDTPAVLINRIIRDALQDASAQLGGTYQPKTVTANASFVNAAAVDLEFHEEDGLYIGKRLTLSTQWTEAAMSEQSGAKHPIYRQRGELLLTGRKGKAKKWNALVNFANLKLPEIQSSFVPLYGVNQVDTKAPKLSHAIRSFITQTGTNLKRAVTNDDLSMLVFAQLSRYPNLPLHIPKSMQEQLLEFNAQKYAYEAVFEEVEEFAEDTQSIEMQAVNSLLNWDMRENQEYQILIQVPSAIARRISSDDYKTKKKLDVNIQLQIALLDENRKPIYEPVELKVKTKQSVKYNSIEGDDFVRQVFYDYIPKVMDVFCTKKIKG